MSLIAVTATGSRLEALMLCIRMMHAQVLKPDRWIILSDSPPYPARMQIPGLNIETYRTSKVWKAGDGHSLASNIQILMELVTYDDKVFFIEDDDYYHPNYLAVMAESWALRPQTEVLGLTDARYYNVATRRYREMRNREHASLCTTAITGRAIDLMRSLAKKGEPFLDVPLWQAPKLNKLLVPAPHLSVGIKGLPGRPGIGVGHQSTFGEHDPTGSVLRNWIGDAANVYLGQEAS